MGRPGALCEASGAVVGRSWGPQGRSGAWGAENARTLESCKQECGKSLSRASWGPLGKRLRNLLGRVGGFLGRLEAILGDLEGSLGDSGPSWTVMGASWGPRGPSRGHHGPEKLTRPDAAGPRGARGEFQEHAGSRGRFESSGSGPLKNPYSWGLRVTGDPGALQHVPQGHGGGLSAINKLHYLSLAPMRSGSPRGLHGAGMPGAHASEREAELLASSSSNQLWRARISQELARSSSC